MATRRVPVEYILRRVPQEGLEGEPVDRIREAFDNKYTGAYMHNFLGERATGNVRLHTKVSSSVQMYSRVWYTQKLQTKVANKSFIVCIRLECRIEKSVPRITVWHHEACRVVTNGDPEGRIFISLPHTNYGFIFCSPLNFAFCAWKRLPEVPEYAEMRDTTWWRHLRITMTSLMTMWVSSNTTSEQSSRDSLGRIAWVR